MYSLLLVEEPQLEEYTTDAAAVLLTMPLAVAVAVVEKWSIVLFLQLAGWNKVVAAFVFVVSCI